VPGTPLFDLIQYRKQEAIDDTNWSKAMGILTLNLLATILMAPLGIPNALFWIGGIISTTTSAYSLNNTVTEYLLAEAASGSDFDKARALSANDPNLFWLVMDCLALTRDVVTMTIKTLILFEKASKAF